MIKLKNLLKEKSLKLGKVYTDKDRPPFKVSEDENPCWKGYKQLGMKEKDGKQVPNCVPIDEIDEAKKRDYKDEYKKFQSSKKSKKYRAELNKYNRKKGTYGNGDKKDASHKGGKIVGYEEQSKNRGRAEKSRLKKNG